MTNRTNLCEKCVALSVALMLFVLPGSGWASTAETDSIRVTVTFEEEFELPEHAVLHIRLGETFDPNQPTAQIGTITKPNPGSPPYLFELPYTPTVIDQRYSYEVKAWITIDRDLWYSSPPYPVLTKGAGNEALVRLIRVGPPAEHALRGLPATFTRTLPCPDCAGVHFHLDLFKEKQIFFLRRSHTRGDEKFSADTIGMWGTTMDRTRWVLWQETPEPLAVFRTVESSVLRMIDQDGKDIEPDGSHDLRRTRFKPIEPRLELRGMYGNAAGVPIFTECLTRQKHLLSPEGDAAVLQREYAETRREPGEELLATFDGRLVEGGAKVRRIAVDRFIGVWPGESCGDRSSHSELQDTYWKLTRIGDRWVPKIDGDRQPHLVLHSEENRATATGGCNRFSGGYEIEEKSMRFDLMAATMMACPEGSDVDQALQTALENTAAFTATSHHLELLDHDGKMVARFEAIPAHAN